MNRPNRIRLGRVSSFSNHLTIACIFGVGDCDVDVLAQSPTMHVLSYWKQVALIQTPSYHGFRVVLHPMIRLTNHKMESAPCVEVIP